MTVSVAIDLALDRLFTYEVPEALQKKLAVGQLLSVPFGHREARGFAMTISNSTVQPSTSNLQPQITLKPISAIVDETPFFSPALLELVKRIAAYTAAPIESVLKTALPAAVLKRNAHAKEQLFVEATGDNAQCPALCLTSLSPLKSLSSKKEGQERQERQERQEVSSRQRWLYDQIVRLGGGWMSSLCRELKTTPSSLRTLAEKGLVKIEVKAKRRDPLLGSRILPTKPLTLNPEQQTALKKICEPRATNHEPRATNHEPRATLLFGVTGSGKTEVYLQAIALELEAGRGAIVMVPEIALTPQTVRRFASRFGDKVAVLHSALSDGERYDEWHRIRSGEARVVVGPRSAVWAPVHRLGLIVVDEEHETSYKQDESPRYHARDVAVLRGAIEGARVVLGSATPSLESWMNVRRGKYSLATIAHRAGAGTMPSVRLVDMQRTKGAIFSGELLETIRIRLDRGEQTILFLNRRGYSRSAVCAACGHPVECSACGIPYTYHRSDDCLRCHVCGGWIPVPRQCPQCGCPSFDFRGIGTERAEAALVKCFPRARVLRMDADSVSRKNSHDDILSAFRRGEADILIGTQMVAKGLDFPNVTLVGVLNADSSLNLPDFRAAERTYQLLAQVAGRAGRAELPGEVIIQTYDESSSVLGAVLDNRFDRFAESELAVREEAFFPPFCHLSVIGLKSRDLKLVADWATMYAASIANFFKAKRDAEARCEVSEAMPAALEKADGWYRWQIVLRSVSPSSTVRAWKWIVSQRPAPRELRVSLDVDAFNVL